MIGIDNGWAGAQDAYDYLWPFIGVQPAWGQVPDLGQRAGWALDFYPGATAPPPPPPATAAALINPSPGSVFASTTQTFSWSAGTGVTGLPVQCRFDRRRQQLLSGCDLSPSTLSATVTGLPNNGSTIWVRLSSQIDGAWQSTDYSFTAMDGTAAAPAAAASTAARRRGARQPDGRLSVHVDHPGLRVGRGHRRDGLPARCRIHHRHQ